ATIAGTDLEVRREFFDRHGWNALVSLPAMQAVIADDDLMADVALANTGDLAAIFRVQRHPRIVALCERDELWRIVNGTRPTEMARELAEIAGRARVR
ncbi:MAG: hypothetical protein KDE27_22435, partial [Planctomycetes bacterium]|nr:hypothetical protein [Planctomycetota bacterium]